MFSGRAWPSLNTHPDGPSVCAKYLMREEPGVEIKERIREFIVSNCLFGDTSFDLRDDTALLDSGIIDSTGVIELVLFLSEAFGLDVPPEDMLPANFNSLGQLTSYVQQRIPVASAL